MPERIAAHQGRPLIDQGGVELHEARPRADLEKGRCRIMHAARPHQCDPAAGEEMDARQLPRRQLKQRPARKPALLGGRRRAEPRARERGVGNDDAIDSTPEQAAAMSSSSSSRRSGAILSSMGGRSACSLRAALSRASKLLQFRARLQRPQARRVGRGDVDREIGGEMREGRDALHIIADPVRRILVGADVDADDAAAAPPRFEPPQHGVMAFVVEAHAVDHRRVLRKPEQPRARVSRLRQRRHRADLGEAEAQRQHLVRHLGILVEARRQPQRIGKAQAQRIDSQHRVCRGRSRRRNHRQCTDRQPMRCLGIERVQQRPGEGKGEPRQPHRMSGGKRCRPFSSGSGWTKAASDVGIGAIDMREQVTPARRLPLEVGEIAFREAHQHEVRLAGEMPGRRLPYLVGGGEVDEAVLQVHRRAVEPALRHGVPPFGITKYLVEESHGSRP